MAKAKDKDTEARRALPGPLAAAAYTRAWQAWADSPEAIRGPQPVAPLNAGDLLLDMAISLRKIAGDDHDDESAAQAYDDAREALEKRVAKYREAEAKAAADLEEAKAKAQAELDEAQGKAEAKAAKDVEAAKDKAAE